jgi:transposase-like protein
VQMERVVDTSLEEELEAILCLKAQLRDFVHQVLASVRKSADDGIEADHGALKRVIRPAHGFQTMKTAAATLTGFEIMRMIRRGHCIQREH